VRFAMQPLANRTRALAIAVVCAALVAAVVKLGG
jgi:hypothetical protein